MPPTAVHGDLIQVGLKRGSLTAPFICHSTRLSTYDGSDTVVDVGEYGREPRKASPLPTWGLHSSGQSQAIRQSTNQKVTPVGHTSGKEGKQGSRVPSAGFG